MPWLFHSSIKAASHVKCKVTMIKTFFPSRREIDLMERYGQVSSDVVQTPQIFQRVWLKSDQLAWYVDVFPNELPDFLVLYDHYQASVQPNTLTVGQEVKVKLKTKTISTTIKSIGSLEPELFPDSDWLSIVLPQMRVNRWDIIDTPQPTNVLPQQPLVNFLKSYITSRKQYLVYIIDRVQERIAPDYRESIPHEMWINIILKRVQNGFYRTLDALLFDLDLITTNAQAYNGPEHHVSIDTRQIIAELKAGVQRVTSSTILGRRPAQSDLTDRDNLRQQRT